MSFSNKLQSTIVSLNIENIDTDQIIPARFLKAVTRSGFGENLFRDWRYKSDGTKNPNFVLNDPKYKGQILVAGRNFGCGSSREHAAWALFDYGFRVVVSSFFADIFRSNALNNFLLPIQVSDHELQEIFKIVDKDSKAEFVVDLSVQTISATDYEFCVHFEISPYKKKCLMANLDDVEYLVSQKEAIRKFERERVDDYHIR